MDLFNLTLEEVQLLRDLLAAELKRPVEERLPRTLHRDTHVPVSRLLARLDNELLHVGQGR